MRLDRWLKHLPHSGHEWTAPVWVRWWVTRAELCVACHQMGHLCRLGARVGALVGDQVRAAGEALGAAVAHVRLLARVDALVLDQRRVVAEALPAGRAGVGLLAVWMIWCWIRCELRPSAAAVRHRRRARPCACAGRLECECQLKALPHCSHL